MDKLLIIGIVFLATIIGAFGSLFLKKGSSNLSRNIFDQLKNKTLILGIVLFAVSSIFYVWALKYAELSLVYPITSLTYVWVAFLSIKYLGEKINIYKWGGIIFIIIGVILITR